MTYRPTHARTHSTHKKWNKKMRRKKNQRQESLYCDVITSTLLHVSRGTIFFRVTDPLDHLSQAQILFYFTCFFSLFIHQTKSWCVIALWIQNVRLLFRFLSLRMNVRNLHYNGEKGGSDGGRSVTWHKRLKRGSAFPPRCILLNQMTTQNQITTMEPSLWTLKCFFMCFVLRAWEKRRA